MINSTQIVPVPLPGGIPAGCKTGVLTHHWSHGRIDFLVRFSIIHSGIV